MLRGDIRPRYVTAPKCKLYICGFSLFGLRRIERPREREKLGPVGQFYVWAGLLLERSHNGQKGDFEERPIFSTKIIYIHMRFTFNLCPKFTLQTWNRNKENISLGIKIIKWHQELFYFKILPRFLKFDHISHSHSS